jgi:hypothetical protein
MRALWGDKNEELMSWGRHLSSLDLVSQEQKELIIPQANILPDFESPSKYNFSINISNKNSSAWNSGFYSII